MGTMIKGASIIARCNYVVEVYGPDSFAQILTSLDPDDRIQLEKVILSSTMYPLELNASLDTAIARLIDPKNPIAVYRSLGRASAEKNLNSVHSIFLRSRGPHGLLEHFPAVRRTYYSDGEPSYERTGATEGIFRVVGASSHTLADCESTAGYFERAVELMGGARVSIVLQCRRSQGNALCEFKCRWH